MWPWRASIYCRLVASCLPGAAPSCKVSMHNLHTIVLSPLCHSLNLTHLWFQLKFFPQTKSPMRSQNSKDTFCMLGGCSFFWNHWWWKRFFSFPHLRLVAETLTSLYQLGEGRCPGWRLHSSTALVDLLSCWSHLKGIFPNLFFFFLNKITFFNGSQLANGIRWKTPGTLLLMLWKYCLCFF